MLPHFGVDRTPWSPGRLADPQLRRRFGAD
jgi:hypothetical protein